MTFQAHKSEEFLELFKNTMQQIRNFPGCLHLELLQDLHCKQVYYTYSYWQSEEALATYRNSQLFITTWAKTKILFAAKPEAVSLGRVVSASV